MAYYTYPSPAAYHLNKFLYDLKRSKELRQRYLQDPDQIIAERGIPEDQAEALKALDQERLAALGVHRLLIFLAQFTLDIDRERERYKLQ